MRITDIRSHVLLDPGYDVGATSSAQDTIVVEIDTDEGVTGVGETDLNAWIARACIDAPGTHTMDRGLRPLLIGRDAADVEAIWQDLYVGTCMTGRRGAFVHVIGAIDIALWDLRGKVEGVPCWKLWGEAHTETLTPYASLQPEVSSFDGYLESMRGHVQEIQRLRGELRTKYDAVLDRFRQAPGKPVELPPELEPEAFRDLFNQLADEIVVRFPVAHARVRVRKPEVRPAGMEVEWSAATVERTR